MSTVSFTHQFLFAYDPVTSSFMLPKTPISKDVFISMQKVCTFHQVLFTVTVPNGMLLLPVDVYDLNMQNLREKMVSTMRWFPMKLLEEYPDVFETMQWVACMIHTGDRDKPSPCTNDVCVSIVRAALALVKDWQRRDTEALKCQTLNGSKGSYTNTDDLADLSDFTPHFRLHGNYVGPGHTGAIKLGDKNWNAKPVDALDEAARDHDWHYHKHPKNKGEADAILSDRAFKAIPKMKTLGGKLKAWGVGVGMFAMSKLGRRNGEKLSYPKPPQRLGAVRKTDQFHNEKLSGNAGSHTNTDDLKGFKASHRQKIPEKKHNPKQNAGKGSEGIVSGLMPTQLQNTYAIKPYYKTVAAPMGKRRVKALFSVGAIGGNGAVGSSTYINGGVILSLLLAKELFAGQMMFQDFQNFERYIIKSARFHFLPSVSSVTAGTLWFMPDPDALDALPVGSTVTPSVLNGHKFAQKHTLWAGQATGPMAFNRTKLFTDAELVSFSSLAQSSGNINSAANAGETRFFAAGVFNVLNGDNISTGITTSLGELFLEFDIEFSEPQNSDIGYLVLQAKAGSLVSPLLTIASATPFDPVVNMIKGTFTNASTATEYAYNPNYYYPVTGATSYYLLPVGTYLFYYNWNISNQTTNTVSSTNIQVNGAVYSSTNVTLYDVGSNTGFGPEFTTLTNTTNAAATAGAVTVCIVRITQITGQTGNKAKIQIQPSLTGASSFNVYQIHHMVLRLPEFAASPICMYFPVGNQNVSQDLALTDGMDSDDEDEEKKVLNSDVNKELTRKLKSRYKLTMTNGMNNPPIVTIDGLTYDDLQYYEIKYRRRFPELNWSSETESKERIIKVNVLSRDRWPKSDALKYHENSSSTSAASNAVQWKLDDDDVKLRTEVAAERKVVEPDSPELVEHPLTRSIHVDPSLAAKFLSALTKK